MPNDALNLRAGSRNGPWRARPRDILTTGPKMHWSFEPDNKRSEMRISHFIYICGTQSVLQADSRFRLLRKMLTLY